MSVGKSDVGKILVDKKVISYIAKEIELNLRVFSSIINEFDRDKRDNIIKSIEFFKSIPELLKPSEKDLAEIKRRAYFRYSTAKKELIELQKTGSSEPIKDKQNEVKKLLEDYITIKEAHSIIKNG